MENNENVICDVCRNPTSYVGNEIITCDKCSISAHLFCYGIMTKPADPWVCQPCSMCIVPDDCVLCPNKGGAMKLTRSGVTWAHVSCALWIPEVRYGGPLPIGPITNISKIPQRRWALVCVLCKKHVGACIQCSKKTCKTAYHVTCAFQHGLKMKIVSVGDEEYENEEDMSSSDEEANSVGDGEEEVENEEDMSSSDEEANAVGEGEEEDENEEDMSSSDEEANDVGEGKEEVENEEDMSSSDEEMNSVGEGEEDENDEDMSSSDEEANAVGEGEGEDENEEDMSYSDAEANSVGEGEEENDENITDEEDEDEDFGPEYKSYCLEHKNEREGSDRRGSEELIYAFYIHC